MPKSGQKIHWNIAEIQPNSPSRRRPHALLLKEGGRRPPIPLDSLVLRAPGWRPRRDRRHF
jgi:hypothetical protein